MCSLYIVSIIEIYFKHSNLYIIYIIFCSRSVCSIEVTHFPFDYQTCNLTFGSWAYSGKQLDVINVSTQADKTSYVLNSEWHVYNAPVDRIVTIYGDIPYPSLVLQLLLKVIYLKQSVLPDIILYA